MRSIFIHLKSVAEKTVAQFLNSNCAKEGAGDWFKANCLYVGFYRDHESEYEATEIEFLRCKLGVFPPPVTVMADISGRVVGYREAIQFAGSILARFEGVVQDDGDGLWTIDELLADQPSQGEYFMEESRRYNGLPVPDPEQ